MKLTHPTSVKLIKLGVILACITSVSTVYGFDTRFAHGSRAMAIPFDLINDHIYLHAGVNGSSPLTFILDTGATSTVLDLQKAKSFGFNLLPFGEIDSGIGVNPPVGYKITDEVSISLPGVVLSSENLYAFSLDRTRDCLKQTVDGVLGEDFFRNFVVEIDYHKRRINLYDPGSFNYAGGGQSLRLERGVESLMFTHVQLKAYGHPSITANLVVDTGGGDLSLTKEFAEENKLLPPAKKMTPAKECGIAGSAKTTTLTGRLEWLELGTFKLPTPLTVFYHKTAERSYNGLLGGMALKNFKVIFDYSRSRMIIERPHRSRV